MKFLDVPQSGSIAGHTHSHNRAGQYKRNRRSPVQPIGTGRRATVRAAFAAGSVGFSALTGPQQDAFSSFAASHPVTDSLGQSIILTGHQMFVRMSIQRINVGLALSTTPPSVLSTASIAPAVFTMSVSGGASLAWTAGDGSGFVTLQLSRPMSSGRRFMKTFWQAAFTADDSTPITYPATGYAVQFGAPVVGQRVFARWSHFTSDCWFVEGGIVSAIVT